MGTPAQMYIGDFWTFCDILDALLGAIRRTSECHILTTSFLAAFCEARTYVTNTSHMAFPLRVRWTFARHVMSQ
jgi:hypothetical protein